MLDYQSYDAGPAMPKLARLAAMGAGVILASSKTAAEIALWQERLGLTDWPAIVENGAALAKGPTDGADYRRLRAALAALGAPFRGFGDMDTAEVAALTGLSVEAAGLAKQRAYSEPGLWQGTEAGWRDFWRRWRRAAFRRGAAGGS